MKINYYTAPSITIGVWGGVKTDENGNDSAFVCPVREDNVHINGDWPIGCRTGEMRRAIVEAVNCHLPEEEGI